MTVILPRRSYSAMLGRLLHDRTADKIAEVVSRIPRSAATIVPYDVQSRVRVLQERQAVRAAQDGGTAAQTAVPASVPGPPTARTAGPQCPAVPAPAGARAAGRGGVRSAGEEISPEQEMKDVRKLRDLVKGRDARDGPATDEKDGAYERPKPPPGSSRSAR